MHKETLKLVYSNKSYWIISGLIFTLLLLVLLASREFLFFEPFLTFHLPQELIPNFILITVFSGLMSLVASLAIYQIRILKTNSKKTGVGVISSLFSIGAGACASCGPIGVSIMTTFGIAGVSTLSFLYDYEIPIRLVAIAILSVTCIMMLEGISR